MMDIEILTRAIKVHLGIENDPKYEVKVYYSSLSNEVEVRLIQHHNKYMTKYVQVHLAHSEIVSNSPFIGTKVQNAFERLSFGSSITKRFFKGLDHITKHINGHPLVGTILIDFV